MKKRTVIGKLFLVFRPKKNDILSEAENIINNYIYNGDGFIHSSKKQKLSFVNMVMNTAIIALSVVLCYMLYCIIR